VRIIGFEYVGPMATSPTQFRHEYVSGAVTVAGRPAAISARIANRGATRGLARVLVLVGNDFGSEVVLDSGPNTGEFPNGLVEPGSVWSYNDPDLPKGKDERVFYWVQIRTTSPDLIPSLAFEETVFSDGKAQGMRQCAYFAPGDFAVFPLHPSFIVPAGELPIEA
jgi:hypothetical protein